jgi:ribosomal protein S6
VNKIKGKKYELVTMFYLNKNHKVSSILRNICDKIQAKGAIFIIEDWGKKQLSYKINTVMHAHYVFLRFRCDDIKLIDEITNILSKNTKDVMRHLLVTLPKSYTKDDFKTGLKDVSKTHDLLKELDMSNLSFNSN